MSEFKSLLTKLIHEGEKEARVDGAVSMPIFQSSTYEYGGEGSYDDVRYLRLNNSPNHHLLAKKLSMLEKTESAVVTSSGMSAISTSLLTFLKPGDHVLFQNYIYGGTYGFITQDLPEHGIECSLVDAAKPESWEQLLKKNTKVFYVESIANPLMVIGDLKAAADFSKSHGLVSMIDNTFATPVNFNPAEIGFDIVLHSATKYLNGHSDIVAGAVCASKEIIEKITHRLNHLGGCLDTHACFLLNRGIKTLALRIDYQNQSAMKVAEALEGNKKIKNVNYPGLKSSESYSRAKELMKRFGGMLSFELDMEPKNIDSFLRNVKIPIHAPSLGGIESLIIQPSKTSHAGLTEDERNQLGITDNLIRLSVGIEDTEELIEDLMSALD